MQSAELVDVRPDGVRFSASADGQYALVDGERREVSSAAGEGMRVTAKLADMALYDIPNVQARARPDRYLQHVPRRPQLVAALHPITTTCQRDVADALAWDEMDAEEVVRAFGGRFLLDDRGNPLAVNPEAATRERRAGRVLQGRLACCVS